MKATGTCEMTKDQMRIGALLGRRRYGQLVKELKESTDAVERFTYLMSRLVMLEMEYLLEMQDESSVEGKGTTLKLVY